MLAGGQVDGDVTVNGSFTPEVVLPHDKSSTSVPLVYLPRLTYTDLQIDASDVSAYLMAWLKWICSHYTYPIGAIFIAPVAPSTRGIVICYIYDTTAGESGLPQYCSGLMINTSTSSTLRAFTVYDWQFSTFVVGDLASAQGTLPIEHGGTGGTTKQTAREGLGFTQVGNSTTPVYFNSNAYPTACTPYSSASVYSASRLTTARTIRTNLDTTAAASFNGTANVTPGITDTLDIAHGGHGGSSVAGARYNLHVPAEIDISDTSGFPFSWGTVCARGNLGNTIGQATADNYYWGVDSTATLWGGKQTNRATSPTWYKAMMQNGTQQDVQRLWSGNASGTSSFTITNAGKFAAIILCGFPGSGDEDLQYACIPSGSSGINQFASNQYWIGYRVTSSGNNLVVQIVENPDGGSFRFAWGILQFAP